ncbi:MAG TPA: RNA polymerase sigma factor [Thermoanaerobaculia bacterium]|nr:RNA polymerase sigma factor [Thermoanaerobaculia bacterium]
MSDEDQNSRFRLLYETYYRSAVGYVVGLGFTREEARDLAQEAFMRVFRAMSTFRGGGPEAEWAFVRTTVRNVVLNEIRSRSRRGRTVSLETFPVEPDLLPKDPWTDGPPATPETDLVAEQEAARRKQWLREAIAELPESFRGALLLRLGGLTYQQIAKAMGITVDAVKARLREAKKRLRERLGEEPTGLDWPAAPGEDDDDQEE